MSLLVVGLYYSWPGSYHSLLDLSFWGRGAGGGRGCDLFGYHQTYLLYLALLAPLSRTGLGGTFPSFFFSIRHPGFFIVSPVPPPPLFPTPCPLISSFIVADRYISEFALHSLPLFVLSSYGRIFPTTARPIIHNCRFVLDNCPLLLPPFSLAAFLVRGRRPDDTTAQCQMWLSTRAFLGLVSLSASPSAWRPYPSFPSS